MPASAFIETLYDLLHEYHTDISAVHWKLVYADGPEVPAPLSSRNVTLFQGADAIRELFTEDTYACYAWNKLCKRKLFDTIRFPVGRVMEDLGIAHNPLRYRWQQTCRIIIAVFPMRFNLLRGYHQD